MFNSTMDKPEYSEVVDFLIIFLSVLDWKNQQRRKYQTRNKRIRRIDIRNED